MQGGGYQAAAKLNSLLTLALEELADVPLYYNLHDLAKLLKTQAPPQDTFRSALVNAGITPPPPGRLRGPPGAGHTIPTTHTHSKCGL